MSVGEIFTIAPSYDNIDARVDWTNIMGKSYDIGAVVHNLADNTYIQGAVPIYSQLGFTSLSYSAPRMYGVTLKMKFGPSADNGLAL